MARIDLTNTAWTKIASAGSPVEIQNLSTGGTRIVESATVPTSSSDAEVLYDYNSIRAYPNGLVNDLYAQAFQGTSTVIVLALAAGGGSSGAVITTASAGTITQTVVTGTSGTLIAANASRKSLRWMNVGAATVTVAPGTVAPTVGQGMVYEASSSGATHQGGSETISDVSQATNAFSFSAAASAVVVVWECQ